jgi:putative membrane protein
LATSLVPLKNGRYCSGLFISAGLVMFYQMLLRLLLSAAGLGLATVFLSGVHVDKPSTLFWAALLLGIANTVVRPILILFTLPATILTLGLFLLVINAAMLGLVSWLLTGFTLSGFWSALGAWFIIAAMQWLGSLLLGKNRFVMKIERLK